MRLRKRAALLAVTGLISLIVGGAFVSYRFRISKNHCAADVAKRGQMLPGSVVVAHLSVHDNECRSPLKSILKQLGYDGGSKFPIRSKFARFNRFVAWGVREKQSSLQEMILPFVIKLKRIGVIQKLKHNINMDIGSRSPPDIYETKWLPVLRTYSDWNIVPVEPWLNPSPSIYLKRSFGEVKLPLSVVSSPLQLVHSVSSVASDLTGTCRKALSRSSVFVGCISNLLSRAGLALSSLDKFIRLQRGIVGASFHYVHLRDGRASIEKCTQGHQSATEYQTLIGNSGLFPALKNVHIYLLGILGGLSA